MSPRRVLQVSLLAGAIGYFVLLLSNLCAWAAGPDPSGYLNEARMIAAGELSRPIEPMQRFRLDDSFGRVFTPFGFTPAPGGRMVPLYTPGTPVHLALAGTIGGWKLAPFLVAPVAAMGCLVVIVALARQLGVSHGLSFAAALLLAGIPVFIAHALQPVSDVLAVFYALLTLWCAGRAVDRPRFAVLAGLAFAIGVAVRPTNILIALPMLIAMRGRIRPIVIAAVSALPIAVALLWYNDALYGSPWITGYGSVTRMLRWDVLAKCGGFHLRTSAMMMTPVLMPLGLGVVFLRRVPRAGRFLLAAWFALFFLFYSFYDICGSPESSRFLLPAFPALVIGYLLLVQTLRDRLAALQRPQLALGFAFACVLFVVAHDVKNIGRQHILHIDDSESIYPETIEWSRRWLTADSVLVSGLLSGAYYHDTGRVSVRWNEIDPEAARVLLAAYPPSAPWYAVLSRVEGDGAALARHIPGEWEAVASHRDITLWRLRR
jgi:Dolichyl-phosphate-mannose-protein mannosyltransferase